MKLLNNAKEIDHLIQALDHCRGDVILRSADGTEEYNLKSAVSRYIAIGELCKDHGADYEFFCDRRGDEGNLMEFFMSLEDQHLNCA